MLHSGSVWAINAAEKTGLATGENQTRIEVLDRLVGKADETAQPFIEQLLNDAVKIEGKNIYVVGDEVTTDALTGKTCDKCLSSRV